MATEWVVIAFVGRGFRWAEFVANRAGSSANAEPAMSEAACFGRAQGTGSSRPAIYTNSLHVYLLPPKTGDWGILLASSTQTATQT